MKISSLITIAILLGISTSADALVKKSNSGLCHDENSSYYSRTKKFTPYDTMNECLNSGGRQPSETVHQPSPVEDAEYKRDKFGHGWIDEDHDGQDTRQEILISQNTGNIVFNSKGRVVRGRWISMYSGKIIVDASKVDIDHIVPLSWAWKHGADTWTQSKREQFANDDRNLVAVEASLNRQKGDKGPDEWLPPTNIKQYQSRFERIVKIYGLK